MFLSARLGMFDRLVTGLADRADSFCILGRDLSLITELLNEASRRGALDSRGLNCWPYRATGLDQASC